LVGNARHPKLPRFPVIEPHRQMPTLVLVGAHLAIGQPQEDAFLIKWSIAVVESQTFGGDIVEGGDTFHSQNDINPL